jgi:hypothetical protein
VLIDAGMPIFARVAVVCALACASVPASAAESKAYKHVDDKGNVTYSQTPPISGKEASRIDISPANGGRGGAAWDPSYAATQRYIPERKTEQDAARERAKNLEDARQQKLAELERECNRSRGTDCKNPETLRYMDAQKIPRVRH